VQPRAGVVVLDEGLLAEALGHHRGGGRVQGVLDQVQRLRDGRGLERYYYYYIIYLLA
jgi:hypothetical protein